MSGKSWRRSQGIDLADPYVVTYDDRNILYDDEEFTYDGIRIKPEFVSRPDVSRRHIRRLRRPAAHRTEPDG